MSVYSPKSHRSSIFKRMDSWDLIHFQDLNMRDPKFVITLPFDQNRVRRNITEGALRRTKWRWSWFAEAQTMNATLGTFSYLPSEIRRRIWASVLQCRDTLSADGLWEYDHHLGPVFDLGAYLFGFGRTGLADNNGKALRLVSRSLKMEYDDAFLSLRTFRFNNTADLMEFVNHLTEAQSSRLLSMDIGICPIQDMKRWIEAINRLPIGLKELRFRIYPEPTGFFESARGQQALCSLDTLVKVAAQSASNAKITVSSTNLNPLSPSCLAAVDITLKNIRSNEWETFAAVSPLSIGR